jgi:selenocysteine lyase/cysteine desulfurase
MVTGAIFESEFPARGEFIQLNHAGVSPWPQRTAVAVARFAEENHLQGAAGYERWLKTEAELRQQMCSLIGAPSPDDIAILKNTSEGLSMIAYGLPWKQGDNIVTSDQEFPSNRIVWQSLKAQGVELREAALDRAESPEDALFALVDERTRLLTVSSVQYATGLRMDLQRIGEFCRRHAILFCVDAIQSLGVLEFGLEGNGADFVVADGHKWMMGPEGVALFYVRPALRDRLSLRQFGWHMIERAGDYDRKDWTVAPTARRFECGSPNMLGIHGLHASLSLLLEIGMPAVTELALENSARLIDAVDGNPEHLELLSNRDPERRSGIVTFRHRRIASPRLYQKLRDQGVVCALRGGGIRYSPHFHTRRDALEKALRLAIEAA